MALSGIFTIMNASSPYYARIEEDSDGAGLTGALSERNRIIDAAKWLLVPAEPGNTTDAHQRYKIKNVAHSRYAVSDYTRSPGAPVFSSNRENFQWWIIKKEDPISCGEDVYSIVHNDHRDMSWRLPNDDNGAPIELHLPSKDRHSLWKITPYPPPPESGANRLPFEDKSILTLTSVEQKFDDEEDGLAVTLRWERLPPYCLEFLEPLLVKHRNVVIAILQVQAPFRSSSQDLSAILRMRDNTAFDIFAATVLYNNAVEVTVEIGRFKLYPEDSPITAALPQYEYHYVWRKPLVFESLHSFREGITLRNLQITGSGRDTFGQFIRSSVIIDVTNVSCLNLRASMTIGIYVGNSKIGAAEVKDLKSAPGKKVEHKLQWKLRPFNPVNHDFRAVINQYITKETQVPILLKVENISTTICGHLINLPRFEINTYIQGIASKVIPHVDVYIHLVPVLLRRRVSFRFDIDNPLDTMLEICKIRLDVSVRGAHIANVSHDFNENGQSFIIKARDKVRSPMVPHAWLDAGYLKALQLAVDRRACLDVKVKSAILRVDQFELSGLEFTFYELPFKIHWF
ncbi:uncharacterized protein LAESUDRAFT_708076 [Laetiporus sulphureus 93-53]|uniref:Uncharacterized protein n=1 Tax=Laetiporus sulphureus 93-53 TaxID=1314785 RepID=A0A165BFW4_9APHY|nr:uncharacterized protein LAESUDRAFT_708076 [Laetiporus sulphureus 93-53]KZT00972.1 hypothetical protein LAESUDRAFT_708076 [Laetiporus sulphureus 93-53]